jgi:hypothetical protein
VGEGAQVVATLHAFLAAVSASGARVKSTNLAGVLVIIETRHRGNF